LARLTSVAEPPDVVAEPRLHVARFVKTTFEEQPDSRLRRFHRQLLALQPSGSVSVTVPVA
jgi:hypothetical protein